MNSQSVNELALGNQSLASELITLRTAAGVDEETLPRIRGERQLVRLQRRRRRRRLGAEAAGGLGQAGQGDAGGELQGREHS